MNNLKPINDEKMIRKFCETSWVIIPFGNPEAQNKMCEMASFCWNLPRMKDRRFALEQSFGCKPNHYRRFARKNAVWGFVYTRNDQEYTVIVYSSEKGLSFESSSKMTLDFGAVNDFVLEMYSILIESKQWSKDDKNNTCETHSYL